MVEDQGYEVEEQEHLLRTGYGRVRSVHLSVEPAYGAVGSHPRPQLGIEDRYGSGGARSDRGRREQAGVPSGGPKRGQSCKEGTVKRRGRDPAL